jgi:hypothetical protein
MSYFFLRLIELTSSHQIDNMFIHDLPPEPLMCPAATRLRQDLLTNLRQAFQEQTERLRIVLFQLMPQLSAENAGLRPPVDTVSRKSSC